MTQKQKIYSLQKGFLIAGFAMSAITLLGVLSSVSLLALNSARAKARDAKRIADIIQLSSALELYFNDHNEYPAKLNSLMPTYIGVIPTAPEPADGPCSAEQNLYSYSLKTKKVYELSFCLGQTTRNYAPGMHALTVSPNGNAFIK